MIAPKYTVRFQMKERPDKMIPLEDFVKDAAGRASVIFEAKGQVLPMLHFVDGDGEESVTPVPMNDKDEASAFIRAMCAVFQAKRAVFITEAWMLSEIGGIPDQVMKRTDRHGIRNEPGRIEVILINGEDQAEGLLMATREIIRNGNHKPTLGPLSIMKGMDQAQGRLVGFLPPMGARQ
jgi:hypothetical protein